MRILIITFARGLNPGTFMQALGVQTGLRMIYPEAEIEFLDFPDFKKSFAPKVKSDTVVNFLKRKAFGAYRLIKYKRLEKTHFRFSEAIDLFEYDENEAKRLLRKYDLIVIGSDTILEKADSDSNKHLGLNWCAPLLSGKPTVLFAASASPARFRDDKTTIERLKPYVRAMSHIGLRDNLTIELFRDTLGVDSECMVKQPDPTYFLDVTQFKLSARYTRKLEGKKVSLYNFNPGCPFRAELADLLRAKGYYVISTAYNPHADLSVDTIDAKEWAGVFPIVSLVVTERFHDSVFALRNAKPVIAIDWASDRFASEGDSKTFRILEDYGLTRFHFNLTGKNTLSDVVVAIDDISAIFNPQKIEEKNEEYRTKALSILNNIKTKQPQGI